MFILSSISRSISFQGSEETVVIAGTMVEIGMRWAVRLFCVLPVMFLLEL